jgi:HD-GYP domain-containing protein (c-di-GMP phosphodiesterase class II)
MTMADTYDALITYRPYRKAMPKEKAIAFLREEAEQGKLIEDVFTCLLEIVTSQTPAREEKPKHETPAHFVDE